MENIISVLKNCPMVFAATVDDKNRPNNRPVALAMEDKGTLYFSTSTETSLYRDLQKNPFISFTTMIDQHSWLQLNAEIVFVDNVETKEMIISNNLLLRRRFQTADNPILKIFKITGGTAKFYDRSGNTPQIVNF